MTADRNAATVGTAWRRVRDRLKAAGIDTASPDARLLARAAFGLEAVALATRENDAADEAALECLAALTERRLAREPVARILGEKDFYGLTFALSPAVLVPRPETELVVDLALAVLKNKPAPRFVDLGTGSGCIAIAILVTRPDAEAVAVDLGPDALDMAWANAERHGVAERIAFRLGNWFEPLSDDEVFDAIVANPPYVARTEIDGLDPEVRDFDPYLALDGGADGLDPFRVLAHEADRYLRPGGAVIVEHGVGQEKAVASLFVRCGFVNAIRHRDLNGHDRVLVATWPGRSKND